MPSTVTPLTAGLAALSFASTLVLSGCASRVDDFRKCVSAATQQEIDSAEANHIAAMIGGNSGSLEHRTEEHGAYYELTAENQRVVIEQCSSLLPDKPTRSSLGAPMLSEIVDAPREPASAPCPAGTRREGEGCVPKDARPGAMVRIPGSPMLYANKHVDVPTFEIDVTEVTLAAYKTCVDARACTLPYFQETNFVVLGRPGYNDRANAQKCHWADGAADHPINCVDWTQASAYCKWAGKRLPTAVEVVFAATGQTGWQYPWGNEAPTRDDPRVCKTYDQTCAVWSNPKGQSKYGVFHLADNVGEWLADPVCEGDAPCKPKMHHVIGGRLTGDPDWQSIGSAYDEQRGPQNGFRCARTPDPVAPPQKSAQR